MSLNWRQAITSALIGGLAALAVGFLLHGTLDAGGLEFAGVIALAIGASRLIEVRKS